MRLANPVTPNTNVTLENRVIMSEKSVIVATSEDTAAAQALIKFYAVNTKSSYERAKVIAKQLGRENVTAEGFALELTNLRIGQLFPGLSLAEATEAHSNLSTRDRVSVSGQTLRNYKASWESVVNAGIIPDVATVDAAFKVISRGKWGTVRKAEEEAIVTGYESQEDRREQYLARITSKNLIALDAARPAKGAKAPKGDPDETETGEAGSEPTGLTVASVEGYMQAIVAAGFEDEELDAVLTALAATIEHLSEVAALAAA